MFASQPHLSRFCSRSLFSNHPSHCRQLSSRCTCPEFDPDGLDGESHLLAACDTCDHPLGWHLPPMELAPDQAIFLKNRGEDALEHCKERDCECPVFAASGPKGKECGLCGHKLGSHQWKEVSSLSFRF